MTITNFDSIDDFLDCITGLVKRGFTFKADYSRQTIELTGGF